MRWRLVFAACSASLIAACASILGIDDGIPRTGDAGADAIGSDSGSDGAFDAASACNLASPFGTPVALGGVATSGLEQHPRLLPDELTLYFQRELVDSGFDLYVATRPTANASFTTPSPIAELDTTAGEADLTVSPDGLRAFFASDRAGGLGGFDIWQATRDASTSPFGSIAPTTNVNSTQTDHEGYYVPGALYLVSDRGADGNDIYRAAEQSGGFAAPLAIPELASPAYDGYPAVTKDELRIYFASTRADAGGAYQPYTATRATAAAPWNAPTLVTELASFGSVLPGWISDDGCRLYLSSDQGGDYDLYVATKSK